MKRIEARAPNVSPWQRKAITKDIQDAKQDENHKRKM